MTQDRLLTLHRLMTKSTDGLRKGPVNCLTRDGRIQDFPEANLVPSYLEMLFADFPQRLEKASSFANICHEIARFWYLLICIHPFQNGNGRAGKAFIREVFEQKGFLLYRTDILDRVIFEGDMASDLNKVEMALAASVTPIGKLAQHF